MCIRDSVSALAVGDDVLDRETDVTKQLAEAKRFLIATGGVENDVADGDTEEDDGSSVSSE